LGGEKDKSESLTPCPDWGPFLIIADGGGKVRVKANAKKNDTG